MSNTLTKLDRTGDTKVMWNPDNPDEVENARRTFKELKKHGFMAYTVQKGGEKGEVMHDFDPNAKAIIMAPALRGG